MQPAQQKVAEELEVIRDKLEYAGSVLSFFIDDMKMISQHLNKMDSDLVDYQWQYTDKHARKTANSLEAVYFHRY